MASWWNGLQARERVLLLVGGSAVALTLYYVLALAPLMEWQQRTQTQLAAERATGSWLAQQQPVKPTDPGDSARRLPENASLLATINTSAGSFGVAAQLKRVTPESERTMSLTFEAVPYASVLRWLLALEQDYGVKVDRARLDQTKEPGLVNAELSLTF